MLAQSTHISYAEGGTIAAVATASYALMQVPSGLLADRVPPKLLVTIGLLGANGLAILFSLVPGYGWLLASSFPRASRGSPPGSATFSLGFLLLAALALVGLAAVVAVRQLTPGARRFGG